MREKFAEEGATLEERVEFLAAQVRLLSARVDELSGGAHQARDERRRERVAASQDAPATAEASEAFFSWVGRSALLQRVSAVCFLLVVALVLRTLTDSQLLDTRIGSLLGLFYATLLMGAGGYLYFRGKPLAPVFSLCGAILMFLIVSEAYTRFTVLPVALAYLLVIGTGALMAGISYLGRSALPILVGTLGMCVAGVAIDYPNPAYPALVVLLFSANALGFVASRLQRCSWLRWTLFLVTAVLVQVWGYKLGLTLQGIAHPAGDLARFWYLPVVAVFFLGYFATAMFGLLRPVGDRVTRFDQALPAVAGAWAFTAAAHVVEPWWGTLAGLGSLGLLAAAAYLGLARRFGERGGLSAVGSLGLFLGGALLSWLSLGALSDLPLIGLAVLGGLGLWAARLSQRWQQGGLRLLSYLLQFFVCLEFGRWLLVDAGRATHGGGLLLAVLLCLLSLWHYRWSLLHPPPAHSRFFSRLDAGNRLCVFLLLTGLVHGFYAARGLYALVMPQYAGTDLAGFMGMQSVLINGGAVLVMILALVRRDREVRNLAVLITLIGALKVFLFDLLGAAGLGINGVPLVLSVFSFGAAVAVESLLLGRWPKESRQAESPGRVTAPNLVESPSARH